MVLPREDVVHLAPRCDRPPLARGEEPRLLAEDHVLKAAGAHFLPHRPFRLRGDRAGRRRDQRSFHPVEAVRGDPPGQVLQCRDNHLGRVHPEFPRGEPLGDRRVLHRNFLPEQSASTSDSKTAAFRS
ncbi:hypothetical protein JF66_12860 [Cryobacterium sp. MLB-32]|nr:hypothetical protein JF66_12860 [Cryobacterium sp. MLB-32]